MKKSAGRRAYGAAAAFVFLCALTPTAAQQSGAAADTVVLPEVTTVISGGALSADPGSVPDFSAALPADAAQTGVFPVLPAAAVSVPEADSGSGSVSGSDAERDVYMEGFVGFGMPAFFTGDFSVYRADSEHPFEIRFMHESMDGYAFKSPGDGFSDTATLLSSSKTFSAGSAVWTAAGSYRLTSAGLQGQSDLFSDITRQTALASVEVGVPFAKGFRFDSSVHAEWFNRYGGSAGSAGQSAEKTAASFVSARPEIAARWEGDSIRAAVSGNWDFALYAGSGVRPVNRGELTLSGIWAGPSLSVWANAGVVGIPGGSGADGTSLVAPFSAGVSAEFGVPFSELPASVRVHGGLDSRAIDFTGLEAVAPFTCFAPELLSLNREQTDWFASAAASVPAGSVFLLEGSAEFRKTAFGNGMIESRYDSPRYLNSGLFSAAAADRTALATVLNVSAGTGPVLISAAWNAEWLDVPAGTDAHAIEAAAGYTSGSGAWTAHVSVSEALSAGADFVPDVGIRASYQVTDAVRLVFKVTDAVKLCTGKTRVYEAPFVSRSGTASFAVRFFF
ncbi:hypothetical protein [Treponema brennaborense]|uniref:TonB-dependent receptor n=1 Tax=Treponema brennaborense (strain DSM 12168 / CIP 105900 / DD5/3) TaxID=906968 RepID=F4LJC5_TREBD|nr:hypothetical protein [Treponema brennaborense]AEE17370.1 hypothetical protein Trebr_1952 [Treponema brennaborense DSM 12168]